MKIYNKKIKTSKMVNFYTELKSGLFSKPRINEIR